VTLSPHGYGDEDILEGCRCRPDLRLYAVAVQQAFNLAKRVLYLHRNKDPQAHAELRDARNFIAIIECLLSAVRVISQNLDNVHSRIRLQLLRRAVRNFDAVIENGESVTAFGFVHVVRRYQDRRAAFGQAKQVGPEVAAALRIDGACRFVEQQ